MTHRGFDPGFSASLAEVVSRANFFASRLSSHIASFFSFTASFFSTSPPHISPLQFVNFHNNSHVLFALVDPGSQLNLVSHALLPFLKYQKLSSPVVSIRGVSGRSRPVTEWIMMEVVLPTGATESMVCAVIPDLACVVLFGLPFLQQIHAIHDVANAILVTSSGPISLTTCASNPSSVSKPLVACTTISDVPVDFSESELSISEQQQLLALLHEYDDLWRGEQRGKVVDVAHRIRLLHNRPIVSRPRPVSEKQKKIIEAEVNQMLTDGIIRPSSSPYTSEVVLVRKKTGDWRFCIDFRPLNRLTIKDKYPLPRIADLVRSIKGSRFFATLDLRGAYWQIPMELESIKYTAFRCFLGLYEFIFMPFGLTNAPATFQRVMDFLFLDLHFKGVLCYLDDILVHSPSFQGAFGILRTVLARLRAAGLKLNIGKSVFFPRKLKYLGQLIEDGRLIPDPEKIEAIRKLKPPSNLHEVRSLLGFLGYYHSFIPNYSEIMLPIFDLLKQQKNSRRSNVSTGIHWTPNHQGAMEYASILLEKAVLEVPLDSDEFMVETDASETAIGAVLNVKRDNEWRPVEFYSKTLNRTQQRWPVREGEAFAIVMALQKFDYCVRGRTLTVHTDHKSLKWMLECQKGKIARWASLLAEYDITVIHRKSQQMLHVDFLSRFIDDSPEPALADRMCYFTSTAAFPSFEAVISAQQAFPRHSSKGFTQKDNVVYYHGLVWVPPALRHDIIAACHSVLPFHHPGIKKTKATVLRIFNWPGLHQDVINFMKSCLYCRRCRSGHERLQGLLRPHPFPGPFDTLYMDFWECQYNGTHFKILTIIDQHTKWAECIPIKDSTAATVTSALLRSWIYRFGVPRTLISDRDPGFTNSMLDRLSAAIGVKRLLSTPYHPEGNSVIESFHRTLSMGLRFVNHQVIPFEEAIDMVLFAYRSTLHSTTGHSPSFLVYGMDPKLPNDSDWRVERAPDAQERLKFLSTLRLDVQLQAQKALQRQNEKKNLFRDPVEFVVGQLVLCRALPLDRLRYRVASFKAVPRWTLPFRVMRVLSSGKAAIVKCLMTQKERQVHIQDVRFIIPPPQEGIQRQEWLDHINQEALSMFVPAEAHAVVQRLFEDLSVPQTAVVSSVPSLKRARQE